MNKLEVRLEQHTPLIHFQWEQDGATLRATEVKPRLDKFIIEKLGGIDKIDKAWRIGNGSHEALDYKMKIKSDKLNEDDDKIDVNKDKFVTKPFPMLLINMGGKERREDVCNFVFHDEIRLIFFCLNPKLLDIIKEYLPVFLATTNFGNRQSKGFGSFYIHGKDENYKNNQTVLHRNFPELKNKFIINAENLSHFQKGQGRFYALFSIIELFYKSLRGGINDCKSRCNCQNDCTYRYEYKKNEEKIYLCNGSGKYREQNNCKTYNESVFYLKSLMFKYAKWKGYQWEKKTIKEKYNDQLSWAQRKEYQESDISIFKRSPEKEEYYLFRDLLGLSTKERWGVTKSSASKENKIERFKSPLLIKPINEGENGYVIYLICNDISGSYLGQSFDVLFNDENRLRCKIYPDFTLKKYFDFLFKKENGEYLVSLKDLLGFPECENHKNFKILEEIFDQIRREYE